MKVRVCVKWCWVAVRVSGGSNLEIYVAWSSDLLRDDVIACLDVVHKGVETVNR